VVKLLHERSELTAKIITDDREFHYERLKDKKKEARLIKPPDEYVADTIDDLMVEFIRNIAFELEDTELEERIGMQRMSAFLASKAESGESYGAALSATLEKNAGPIKDAFSEFFGNVDHQNEVIRPMCPSCDHSSRSDQDMQLKEKGLEGNCINDHCGMERYRVHPENGSPSWMIHYLIDPTRDLLMRRMEDVGIVHVFGGDYGRPWGRDKLVPLGRRQYNLMEQMMKEQRDGPPLHYYVGPMLQMNGKKIGKREGDAHEPPSVLQLETVLTDAKGRPSVDMKRHSMLMCPREVEKPKKRRKRNKKRMTPLEAIYRRHLNADRSLSNKEREAKLEEMMAQAMLVCNRAEALDPDPNGKPEAKAQPTEKEVVGETKPVEPKKDPSEMTLREQIVELMRDVEVK
jgi:hypothetical protein